MAQIDGEGVDRDMGLALEWLPKSAPQGYIHAYFNRGVFFNESASSMDSQYRSETLIKAYMLLALAVAKDPTDGGSARAEAPKAKIAEEMTPGLIAEALRQAELFGN